jgi:hypothetical protein
MLHGVSISGITSQVIHAVCSVPISGLQSRTNCSEITAEIVKYPTSIPAQFLDIPRRSEGQWMGYPIGFSWDLVV